MTTPDTPPAFDRRTVRRFVTLAVLLAVGAGVGALTLGGRTFRQALDVRAARSLFHAVRGDGAAAPRSLTDAEFDTAVGLLDSASRDARNLAAQSAGESADSPARLARLADVARRQITGDRADDRHTALLLATVAYLPEFREHAEALRADPDPGVRVMADAAAAHFRAGP